MSQPMQPRAMHGLFMDEHIDITGLTFLSPVFIRCRVERRKTLPTQPTEMWNAVYQDCTFLGDGWPEWWPRTEDM